MKSNEGAMNRMKKAWILVLILLFVTCFVGCGREVATQSVGEITQEVQPETVPDAEKEVTQEIVQEPQQEIIQEEQQEILQKKKQEELTSFISFRNSSYLWFPFTSPLIASVFTNIPSIPSVSLCVLALTGLPITISSCLLYLFNNIIAADRKII